MRPSSSRTIPVRIRLQRAPTSEPQMNDPHHSRARHLRSLLRSLVFIHLIVIITLRNQPSHGSRNRTCDHQHDNEQHAICAHTTASFSCTTIPSASVFPASEIITIHTLAVHRGLWCAIIRRRERQPVPLDPETPSHQASRYRPYGARDAR
ncbi:hypothetical protein BKA62DRAFT_719594 [Auriculariales sp. MPI-PUGE-AT-0066]|nr:hypothetical protein BKA62DRAFT_719594 [Auriculariales sp. MPI-PUGE-AT-0066]